MIIRYIKRVLKEVIDENFFIMSKLKIIHEEKLFI